MEHRDGWGSEFGNAGGGAEQLEGTYPIGAQQSTKGFAEASSLEAGSQVLETWLYFQDFENVT